MTKKPQSFTWDWVPNDRVGPLKFGTPLQDYMSDIEIRLEEPENSDVTGWGEYEIVGMDKTVYTEDGLIVCISCYDSLIYKRENIVGMTETEFVEFVGQDPDKIGTSVLYDDGSIQTPFEYDDLGLIAWFEKDKLVCASCNDATDDKDELADD